VPFKEKLALENSVGPKNPCTLFRSSVKKYKYPHVIVCDPVNGTDCPQTTGSKGYCEAAPALSANRLFTGTRLHATNVVDED
jgi:hypothetical protein